MPKANLISPYGGKLVNLVVTGKERDELVAQDAHGWRDTVAAPDHAHSQSQ